MKVCNNIIFVLQTGSGTICQRAKSYCFVCKEEKRKILSNFNQEEASYALKTHHHGVHVACHGCEDPTCNRCHHLTEHTGIDERGYCHC